MLVLKIALQALLALSGLWLFFMLAYQMYLTVYGFRKVQKDYKEHDPQAKFLVLIPAHNEEQVISDIVENLQAMDYPKDLYDFYVIADNCTDRTAEVAKSLGANVIETRKESPDSPTGKPIALRKALNQLEGYQERYDLMMIFDADNLIDKHLFREVNSQWLDTEKPDFIQCYLGAKNKDGLIAWFYYTSYTITNRFFQLAKHRLGLNCSIGGTGFAVSTQYLHQRGGWTTMSLTEDFEIQVEATLEGKRILWNHFARVYDEKPTRFKTSMRQKIRWGQGHWFVCLRNTPKVFRSLLSGKIRFAEFISILTYMYSLSAYVIALLQLLLNLLLAMPCFAYTAKAAPFLPSFLSGLLIFTYSYFGLFYYADKVDNHISFRWRTIPLMIVSYAVNIIISVANQLIGLLLCRNQHTWVKTEHSISAAQRSSKAA